MNYFYCQVFNKALAGQLHQKTGFRINLTQICSPACGSYFVPVPYVWSINLTFC